MYVISISEVLRLHAIVLLVQPSRYALQCCRDQLG